MIEIECPYCKQIYKFKNKQQYGAHKTNCVKNPNRIKTNEKISNSLTKDKKNYKFICECGKTFYQKLSLSQYENKRYNKFCSKHCANTRSLSLETKRKISKSLGGNGTAICERPTKRKNVSYINQNTYERKLILWHEQCCKCNKCSFNLYDPIVGPYELHHIDGNHDNKERWNEELLCCNCHAMTDNYGFKGRNHTEKSKLLMVKNKYNF